MAATTPTTKARKPGSVSEALQNAIAGRVTS